MLEIPAEVLALAHEIIADLGPHSDGGRKVTLAEGEAIAAKALALAEGIASAIAARKVG